MEIKELTKELFSSTTTLDQAIEEVVKGLFDAGMTLDQIIEAVSTAAEVEDSKRSLKKTNL